MSPGLAWRLRHSLHRKTSLDPPISDVCLLRLATEFARLGAAGVKTLRPLFSCAQRNDAINHELHRERRKHDAKEP
jgi:hypothetical protein